MARRIQEEAGETNDKKYEAIGKKLDEIINKAAHIDFENKTLTTQAITEADIEELRKTYE
jgi:hypothetical protein